MKRRFALLLAAALMTSVAACGDDDESAGSSGNAIAEVEIPSGELAGAELVDAADSVCDAGTAEFGELGNRGLTNAGIAAEMAATAEIQTERAEKIAEIQAADDAEGWAEFVKQEQALPEASQAIADAAEAEDDEAVSAAFTEQGKVADARAQAAETVGLEVCGAFPPLEAEETGTGPADDLTFAEPSNTVAEATDALVAAAKSGDCDKLNAQRSTENPPYDAAACKGLSDAYGKGEVLGSEQYGPVGVTEFEGPDGAPITAMFIEEDDGVLRFGGDTINDGVGLRPANEENDADETIDEVVTAVRDEDSAAFNDVQALNSSGAFDQKDDESFDAIGDTPEGKQLVDDIRADDEAAPEPLGINQAYAFYYLEADGNGYVLGLQHQPGSRGEYGFSLFYSVPTE